MTDRKYVYLFPEGDRDQKDLLGGKGANLAEMTNLGLPVPPGFTITTQACNDYIQGGTTMPEGLLDQVQSALRQVEEQTGKSLGDPERPLLVSVRSGAKFSMPGMMDTILDLGLNDATLQGLIAATGDARFGYDSLRRFIMMYGDIVLSIDRRKFDAIFEEAKEKAGVDDDADLPADALLKVVTQFRALVRQERGSDFPDDPMQQLELAIRAVFDSWNNERAVHYRKIENIPDDLGTAVNVQAMVFGNMGGDSGSGVAFTRDPVSGERTIWGEYMANAQGEDVVSGIRTPMPIAALKEENRALYDEFAAVAEKLDLHYRDAMDIEFTVEQGKLYMLQCRVGKRTTRAAITIAVDMVHEGLISKEEAVLRVAPNRLDELLHPQLDPGVQTVPLAEIGSQAAQAARGRAEMIFTIPERGVERLRKVGALPTAALLSFAGARALGTLRVADWRDMDEEQRAAFLQEARFLEMAQGLAASPGAAAGASVFDPDTAAKLGHEGKDVILVRKETSPDDIHGMQASRGVLTQRGGMSSHAALVARGFGIPCVSGCEAIDVDESRRSMRVGELDVSEGQLITIDGSSGRVLLGLIPSVEAELFPKFTEFLSWADDIRRLGVRTNADTPQDAAKAVEFGAEGIGLCRTEHMFLEKDRLPVVREMILAAAQAKALEADVLALDKEHAAAEGEQRQRLEERLSELRGRLEGPMGKYRGSLDRLEPMQQSDFEAIFRVLGGRPVTIRLIDPPMHEFLPDHDELLESVARLRVSAPQSPELREKETLLRQVDALREVNPMLGLRGCRLGILYPEVNEMQVRAIFRAAATVTRDGVQVQPEVMIPLVGFASELKRLRSLLERVARDTMQEEDVEVPYLFGTMIELPRAALTAGEIAGEAEFFSFGTNDLTQTTLGFSRDDAEASFLSHYLDEGILADNPFETIDQAGVGALVRQAVKEGRKARPNLKLGICGEHGGDPRSIEFFHQAGLDYVSCSPYRVPIARLAAAHATLADGARDGDK
ncbi:MAG: pyruvate, phosphate dikinase [Chloroflexi bacterium]|nr:pyruvate, phosphate dikinase [Chloroflexota bacterium]